MAGKGGCPLPGSYTHLVFEFDDSLNLEKDYFLGDPEEIRKRMAAVAGQGSAKTTTPTD